MNGCSPVPFTRIQHYSRPPVIVCDVITEETVKPGTSLMFTQPDQPLKNKHNANDIYWTSLAAQFQEALYLGANFHDRPEVLPSALVPTCVLRYREVRYPRYPCVACCADARHALCSAPTRCICCVRGLLRQVSNK